MYNKDSKTVKIYATGLKGFKTIEGIASVTKDVVICLGKDSKVVNDYSEQIIDFCKREKLLLIEKDDLTIPFGLAIASGWQKMIYNIPSAVLVVFHDSLLPRYRGFNPLVSALLNKDEFIGVTALEAAEEYDSGNVFLQKKIKVMYPIDIFTAINKISCIYHELAIQIYHEFVSGNLCSYPQDESLATYSLWRDEDDYVINWNSCASDIELFINSVGYPYRGASTFVNNDLIRIKKVTQMDDVVIENRTPGKIIFFRENKPVVVCGTGLIKIDSAELDNGDKIERFKFRTRFAQESKL